MKNIVLFLFLVVVAFSTPNKAYANTAGGDIAPQPCDTKFWQQMSSRAWLEAEREIMQNQNLIFKADSVLAYACFDQFLNYAARKGGEIFTHTEYFRKLPIEWNAAGSVDKSMKDVVAASASAYFSGNFSHKYLGGRADKMHIPADDYKKLDGSIQGSKQNPPGFSCTEMSKVWQTAKCANFIDNSEFNETDGFYPFKEMKGHAGGPTVKGYTEIKETRQFPQPCAPPGPSGDGANKGTHLTGDKGDGTWESQFRLATNEKDAVYDFGGPLNEIFADVGKKLKPGDCSGKKGIPTGVQIYVKNEGKHQDGACTNPGCTYNEGGMCE